MYNSESIIARCENVSLLCGLDSKPFSIRASISNEMEEIWKDIKGWESRYQVSNYGKIRNKESGHILKLINSTRGYDEIILSINGSRIKLLVHRLVAGAFISNPENKPQINHKNGNKKDNRIENIEWVTAKENTVHAFNSGVRKDKGDNHYMCKIKQNQRDKIFRMRKSGMTYKSIAQKFGVSESHIWGIINKDLNPAFTG